MSGFKREKLLQQQREEEEKLLEEEKRRRGQEAVQQQAYKERVERLRQQTEERYTSLLCSRNPLKFRSQIKAHPRARRRNEIT